MLVHVTNEQGDVPISLSSVEPIVKAVIEGENTRYDEAGVHFVSTGEICRLHALYFDDPSPTDCISFPLDIDPDPSDPTGASLLGDAFVCPATAVAYVAEHGGDLYDEITLYLVHCLLHLLGYDDIAEQDESLMRAAEARHMRRLKELRLTLRSAL